MDKRKANQELQKLQLFEDFYNWVYFQVGTVVGECLRQWKPCYT